MIHVADYGTRIEAYDRLPSEPGTRYLAVAQRAEKGDDWRGWRIHPVPHDAPSTFVATKREARDLVEFLAARKLAERPAGDFYGAQLARLATAIGQRDGAGVIAVLEYLAAEGDRETAEALADYMAGAGVLEVTE
jgi:hypothetical protein